MSQESAQCPVDIACGPELPAELGALLRGDLSADAAKAALIRLLESLCGVALAGFVLYGSAARGAASPGDIDALVITREPASGGLWGAADGVEIDFHVYGLQALLQSSDDQWPHLSGAKALYDPDGVLGAWLARLAVAPTPAVPASRVLRERVWARRMLRRVAERQHSEPGVAVLRAAELLSCLPETQAAVTGVPRGSITGWWRQLDPLTQELVLQWAESPLSQQGIASLNQVVERILSM